MVFAYVVAPRVPSARIHASYQKLIDFISHHPSAQPPAATAPEDRHMDPSFESDLRASIPISTPITISAVPGDQESLVFAQEIVAWMRANGWQHVQGVSEHRPRELKRLFGTNLQINPKGGMELVVAPRLESAH